MNEHSIFYYPYASFRNDQLPLLKAAALYFDKLYILDPIKVSWDMIGPSAGMKELELLEQEGILERVAPEEILHDDNTRHLGLNLLHLKENLASNYFRTLTTVKKT